MVLSQQANESAVTVRSTISRGRETHESNFSGADWAVRDPVAEQWFQWPAHRIATNDAVEREVQVCPTR